MQGRYPTNRQNLLDINFGNLSVSERRGLFFLMSLTLQQFHQKGYMPQRLTLDSIYFEDGYCIFNDMTPISNKLGYTTEEIILENISSLTKLVFCLYIPEYDFRNGLLDSGVLSEGFEQVSGFLPIEDRDYFRMISVDSYQTKKLPKTPYYNDYINNSKAVRELNGPGNGKYLGLSIKPEGSAGAYNDSSDDNRDINFGKIPTDIPTFVDRELGNMYSGRQAAFGNTFFFVTVVTAISIIFAGIITYFLLYLG